MAAVVATDNKVMYDWVHSLIPEVASRDESCMSRSIMIWSWKRGHVWTRTRGAMLKPRLSGVVGRLASVKTPYHHDLEF